MPMAGPKFSFSSLRRVNSPSRRKEAAASASRSLTSQGHRQTSVASPGMLSFNNAPTGQSCTDSPVEVLETSRDSVFGTFSNSDLTPITSPSYSRVEMTSRTPDLLPTAAMQQLVDRTSGPAIAQPPPLPPRRQSITRGGYIPTAVTTDVNELDQESDSDAGWSDTSSVKYEYEPGPAGGRAVDFRAATLKRNVNGFEAHTEDKDDSSDEEEFYSIFSGAVHVPAKVRPNSIFSSSPGRQTPPLDISQHKLSLAGPKSRSRSPSPDPFTTPSAAEYGNWASEFVKQHCT